MTARKSAKRSVEPTDPTSIDSAGRALLGILAFCAGAAIMVIEISGNRLLAPVFGNSMFTWTALIGVVLVAIAGGGYFGGKLVDRHPDFSVLGFLLLGAAASTAVVPLLEQPMQAVAGQFDLLSGVILFSLILFALPGCLLGAVTPFVIRMLSRSTGDRAIGVSAGIVGMLGTLGSFLGTFGAGFVLIPMFGVRTIFLFTALGLGLLGLLTLIFFRRGNAKHGGLGALTGAALVAAPFTQPEPPSGTLHVASTFYHEIRVFESVARDGVTNRFLQLDSTLEGGQRMPDRAVVLPYQQYWEFARLFAPDLEAALFFGGGAFAMPERLSASFPQAEVEVVEIDPHVIAAGRVFFGLDEFPRVKPHASDARRYLLKTERSYDLIFGDAYNGIRNVPAHLVTAEFFGLTKSRLKPGGVYMMNLISAARGRQAGLFEAVLRTLRSQFKHVEVFAVATPDLSVPQNLILAASDRDLLPLIQGYRGGGYLANLIQTRIESSVFPAGRGQLLTDNHNPVEFLVARQLTGG